MDQFNPYEKDQADHQAGKNRNWLKWLIIAVVAVVILLLSGVAYWYALGSGSSNSNQKQASNNTQSSSSAAVTPTPTATADLSGGPECGDKKGFGDLEVGLRFCYPKAWGRAIVKDAKVSPSDAGYREVVTFSDNLLFMVGGVSESWSTTVGRGVGCLEPNNTAPDLSSYNTEWHDIIGSGETIDFATRSLPTSMGGYDKTETVDNQTMGGVCVQSHKTISGSRYKVAFAAYYRPFPEASGITTPALHMDNPNVLFSEEQRQDFEDILVSLTAY